MMHIANLSMIFNFGSHTVTNDTPESLQYDTKL